MPRQLYEEIRFTHSQELVWFYTKTFRFWTKDGLRRCVRNAFWNVCAMCVCANLFWGWEVQSHFCTLLADISLISNTCNKLVISMKLDPPTFPYKKTQKFFNKNPILTGILNCWCGIYNFNFKIDLAWLVCKVHSTTLGSKLREREIFTYKKCVLIAFFSHYH